MGSDPMVEFHYRVPWLAEGSRPGHHRARCAGAGFEFRGHATLHAEPDARRLDVRASINDPSRNWQVRVFNQRSSIRVILLADLSASMGFEGRHRKFELIAAFTESAAYSAARAGDAFGFIGADARVRKEFFRPPRAARGAGAPLAQRLRTFIADGDGAGGLPAAANLLGRQRALIFLLSDFHWPAPLMESTLAALTRHAVVPVVLWDEAELKLPRSGFATLVDAESGTTRFIWLRRGLREAFARQIDERREYLLRTFLRFCRAPLYLRAPFDADAVTDYFFAARPRLENAA